MSTYCAVTDITNALVTGHGLTADEQAAIVADASAWTDAALCARYWHFPAITDSPATPGIVKQITRQYGLWVAWTQYLGGSNRLNPGGADLYRQQAEEMVAGLMAIPPQYQIPPETVTDEEMTFGTSPLESDEWLFSIAPYDIKPESVRVSGYEWGSDFQVYRSLRYRGWVFRTLNSAITDASTVTYEYTYTRRTELDLPPQVGVVKLYRA